MSRTVLKVIGQPPKLRASSGAFIRVVSDGFVLDPQDEAYPTELHPLYLTCEEGGGFGQSGRTHQFREPGTRVFRLQTGNPFVSSVTSFEWESAD